MAKKAFKQIWKSITGTPAVDLAGKRYHFVNFDANGDINIPAAGGVAVGVLEEPNKVGEPAQVVASGFSYIILGGTVAAGAEVQADAAGAAVALTTGKSLGILAVGGVAGDIGTVLLK
jgi:hypothetical protein